MSTMIDSPPLRSLAALGGALAVCLILAPATAHADSNIEASYPFERAWPTAVRFLRIDEGHRVVERDAETGYILFEVSDSGRKFSGSMEVIRITDSERRKAIRVVVRIPDRPEYMEHGMLTRLEQKLRHELGEPAPPPPPPPEKPEKSPESDDEPPKKDGSGDDARKGDNSSE